MARGRGCSLLPHSQSRWSSGRVDSIRDRGMVTWLRPRPSESPLPMTLRWACNPSQATQDWNSKFWDLLPLVLLGRRSFPSFLWTWRWADTNLELVVTLCKHTEKVSLRKKTAQNHPKEEMEFFQPYSSRLIVILEGRISPSYFVSSRS